MIKEQESPTGFDRYDPIDELNEYITKASNEENKQNLPEDGIVKDDHLIDSLNNLDESVKQKENKLNVKDEEPEETFDASQKNFEDIFDAIKKERYAKRVKEEERRAVYKDIAEKSKERLREVVSELPKSKETKSEKQPETEIMVPVGDTCQGHNDESIKKDCSTDTVKHIEVKTPQVSAKDEEENINIFDDEIENTNNKGNAQQLESGGVDFDTLKFVTPENKEQAMKNVGREDKWEEDWNEETEHELKKPQRLGATMQFDKIKEMIEAEQKSKIFTFDEAGNEYSSHHKQEIDNVNHLNSESFTEEEFVSDDNKIVESKEENNKVSSAKTPVTEDSLEINDNADNEGEEDFQPHRDKDITNKSHRKHASNVNNSINKKPIKDSRQNFHKDLFKASKLYKFGSDKEKMKVINGNFSDILRAECLACAKYAQESEIEREETSNKYQAKNNNELDETKGDTQEIITDYEDDSDAPSIKTEILKSQRLLLLRTLLTGTFTAILLILALISRFNFTLIGSFLSEINIVYLFINTGILILSVIVCKNTMSSGVGSLLRFKGNSDSAVAFAAIAGLLQGISSLFASDSFKNDGIAIYTLIIVFGLFLNSYGKLLVIRRVFNNFNYITSKDQKYAAKIYTDEEFAKQMYKGLGSLKPIIAYQKKFNFPQNFLKLSYDPDPSEKFAGKIAIPGVVISLFISIIYGLISKDFISTVSALAICACVCTPMSALIALNKPVKDMCKKANMRNSMLIGYPAVTQFSDTNGMVIDAGELYSGSVIMHGIKTFGTASVDKVTLETMAILKEAMSPLAGIFNNVVNTKNARLPYVEKLKYIDGAGIEAWVSGRRILIGNRIMLENHSILPPSREHEKRYRKGDKQITYVAVANELVAMILTSYRPTDIMIHEMQRLEDNGVSFMITTTDPNVTPRLVAEHFRLFFRSVKVLPAEENKAFKSVTKQPDEKTRAYLFTNGKITSFTRFITACIRLRANATAAIVVQCLSIVISTLVSVLIIFFSGANNLHLLEMFLFLLFWVAVTIAIPYVRKP